MTLSLRSAAAGLALLTAGFAGGLSVGSARGDALLAQATPPAGSPPAARSTGIPGLDAAALERAVSLAVTAAVEKATAASMARLGAVERLGTEIATIRRTMVSYAAWGAIGLFVLLVLASVIGGSIVTLLFRPRRA